MHQPKVWPNPSSFWIKIIKFEFKIKKAKFHYIVPFPLQPILKLNPWISKSSIQNTKNKRKRENDNEWTNGGEEVFEHMNLGPQDPKIYSPKICKVWD